MQQPFIEALLSSDRPVIAEVKVRNAHRTDLMGGRSPRQVVETYEEAGFPCLSVVTGRWFGGTRQLLREVTARTGLPVLQKDFITRRDQLTDAAESGAGAVLLTAALLPAVVMRSLVTACLSSGMTPFVEITTEAELEAVPHADECVIAVNNKDIRSGERGPGAPDRSFALLPALRAAGTPCPVSASAIHSPQLAAGLLSAGYAGLLVGTALMREESPARWLRDMDDARSAGDPGRALLLEGGAPR